MDEYQYDELSMAMGFAHFAVELAAAASPVRSPILRPPISPRQRSLRWQNSGHFHLSRSNSCHDHDNFPGIVPEYVEETVLERLQVEIDVIVEEEGTPPIIDGPIYTDDEVLKLDLFHRSRSNTVSFEGSSKSKQSEGYFASSPVRANIPSGRSSLPTKSSDKIPAHDTASGKVSPVESSEEVGNGPAQKALIQNMLMGIASRQQPIHATPADVDSTPSATNTTPATDQKADIRNKLMAGLAGRKPLEPTEVSAPSSATNTSAATDEKADIRNKLMAGLAGRKPLEPTEVSAPSSATNTTPATDQKADIRNKLMAGLAGRKPIESTEVTAAPSAANTSPATDQKADIRNKLMAGLAGRKPLDPTESSEVPITTGASSSPAADQKAQVRNMLLAGLAARKPPTEPTSSTITPTKAAGPAQSEFSKNTPNSSRVSDITETDSWSPALRELPPLPTSCPSSPPIPPAPGSNK